MLDTGGDFANGVIVHEGAWLGGGTFVCLTVGPSRCFRPKVTRAACASCNIR
jgi:hypothetical protein